MSRLNHLVTRSSQMLTGLDDFVAQRASRPLWVFGWTLFVAGVWFLGSFYLSAGEQLAALDRERATIGTKNLETIEVRRLYDVILEAWTAVAESARFYQTSISKRSAAEPLPSPLISKGLEVTVAARKRVAVAIGTISATHLSDQQMAATSAGVREDLEAADRTLATLEEFFKAYSSGQSVVALSRLHAADQDVLGAEREGASALARAKSWPDRADALITELIAEANLLNAKRRAFDVKLYASIPTLAYLLAFIGLASFRLKRRSKSARSVPRV